MGGNTSPLREMLEGPLAQFSSHVERLFEETRIRARREVSEQLNQAARRMRLADSFEELSATLVDAAAAFAGGAALFRIDGEMAHGVSIRGVSQDAAWSFADLQIPLESAAAVKGAVETRDPVTALAAAAEISEPVAALLQHPADAHVEMFPLVGRDAVRAVLYCWGNVQGPVIELLVQVASSWDEPPAPLIDEPEELVTIAPEELVSIDPAPAGPVAVAPVLSGEEERLHLRARRFARVEVARMRLEEPAAVQSGRAQRDLYGALQARIEGARTKFRTSFCSPCASMTDYLHQELVRTLAHDDTELLGKDYPGPLV